MRYVVFGALGLVAGGVVAYVTYVIVCIKYGWRGS